MHPCCNHTPQAELSAPAANLGFLPAGWGAPSPGTPAWDDESMHASTSASPEPMRPAAVAAAAARDVTGTVDTASPPVAGDRSPVPQPEQEEQPAPAEHASPPQAATEHSPKLEPLPGPSPPPPQGRAARKAAGMQQAQLAPARREMARTSQHAPTSQRASLLAAQHEALDATYEAERVLEERIRMLQAQMEQFLAEEGGEPGGGGGGAFLTDAAAADAAEGAPGVPGGGSGGGGEKGAAAAGGVGHLPHSSPPPLRTYSRSGLAALDEVLRRDIGRVVAFFADLDVHESGIVTRSQFVKAMPLLTFAQPSAAKCKRDMDQLFDALDTDGVGLVSYKELPQVLASRAASSAARSAPRSRRRAAPALPSPAGKVAGPSEPAS